MALACNYDQYAIRKVRANQEGLKIMEHISLHFMVVIFNLVGENMHTVKKILISSC